MVIPKLQIFYVNTVADKYAAHGMTVLVDDRVVRLPNRHVAESGSRGFLSPSPHTTPRAGPHGAVHRR